MSLLQDQNSFFYQELEKLNEVQRQAVEQIEGPVLVIAGPGTGKTQILSARIGNILLNTDSQPHNILCLTYTDAGTIAMRKRLLSFIGPDAYRVHIYTFHAFCNQIIQENLDIFGYRDLQPVSDLESLDFFHDLIDSFPSNSPLKRYKGDIYYDTNRLQHLFALMKREAWSPETIKDAVVEYLETEKTKEEYYYKRASGEFKKGDFNVKKFNDLKEKYDSTLAALKGFQYINKKMESHRRYDYNDMILWVLNAFKEHPSLLSQYQERYHYILVDEYQDTNGAQNEILNLLTSYWEAPNVFVVGDDDQAIYRFQGAEIANIVDFFNKHKEELKLFLMKENYRSSQPILDASGALIKNNHERLVNKLPGLDKDLLASNPLFSSLDKRPVITEYFNTYHEEAALCQKLEEMFLKGEDLGEVAVIYRNHRIVENVVKYLEERKIPLNIRQKVNILELPLVKNIISLLTYIWEEYKDPDSSEHILFEIMHSGYFEISPRDIARINQLCRKKEAKKEGWRQILSSREILFKLNLETASQISKLEENLTYWIGEIPNVTVQVLFEKILTRGGILSWVMDSADKAWNLQVITTFFDFIKEESAKNKFSNLGDILKTLSLMTENNIAIPLNKFIHNEKGINFITAHSSKGLEFNTVFLISSTADIWDKARPGNNFKLPENLVSDDKDHRAEDGRRLFYVAMTRAKENLFISYSARKANDKENEACRYVAELIDSEKVDFEHISLPDEKILEYQAHIMMEQGKIKIDFLDKEFLKEELRNYSMSVTHLNKYLSCPVSFYFDNILKVPSARNESLGFGSAVHEALQNLFLQMRKNKFKEFPSSKEFIEFFEDGMKHYHSHFTKAEYKRRLEYGHKILPPYYDQYIQSWEKNVKIEYRVTNCEIEGVPVTGALDKMEIFSNQVHVTDYKTGKPENGKKKLSPPGEKDPLGGDYWRQIVFYKILLENDKSSSYEMISGTMDFVEPDKKGNYHKIKITVKPEDITLVKNQIKETYKNIMDYKFSEGCGEENCSWCNFVRYNYLPFKVNKD